MNGGHIKNKNLFILLKQRKIIDILIGDEAFGTYKFEDETEKIITKMPYLKGIDLCEISTYFGLPVIYNGPGGNLSRWKYLDNLLDHCINENRCPDLLSYLFSSNQLAQFLSGHNANAINKAHEGIINAVLGKINGILYFGGNELVYINNQFVVRKFEVNIEMDTPRINDINRDYIRSLTERASNDIARNDFDSAITKSRTLLEEVCYYVIEKKQKATPKFVNIGDLYKQVKTLYKMHADAKTDKRINELLSGLEKIISSIAEMRNKNSDSHGVGAARIAIKDYHARLFLNASKTMAEFILAIGTKEDDPC